VPRRGRPLIHPGSLADRIRTACPQGTGATLGQIQSVALARPEDVKLEVNRLRDVGWIRTWGRRRAMRYFWQP